MSRPFCYQCYRSQSHCLCGEVQAIDNQLNVIILQHPDEIRHPRGSSIIARLCLQKVDCLVGEDFSSHKKLQQILQNGAKDIALVYPAEQSIELKSLASDPQKNIQQLIFIDASWRKAKKMFLLSKNLHQLPCINLPPQIVSNYRIRKAPKDGYVSTIEAISYCLDQLEEKLDVQPMLDIFTQMIDQQIHRMGTDIFNKNYPDA